MNKQKSPNANYRNTPHTVQDTLNNNVTVVARIRPVSNAEVYRGGKSCITVSSNKKSLEIIV